MPDGEEKDEQRTEGERDSGPGPSPSPGAGARRPFLGQFQGLWLRLPRDTRLNLENNFRPEDPLARGLPGETLKLRIQMAWYRDLLGRIFFDNFRLLLLVTFGVSAVLGLVAFISALSAAATAFLVSLPLLFLFLLGYEALRERIEFEQVQLIKTNARLIISIPQKGTWLPLVDNIEIKGMPSVVDTNWSRNPIWRLFQALTGARDLYLSLAGYQFDEETARVRDALVIHDVMPDDVFALKKLIFTIGPPATRFVSPQPVYQTSPPEES